MSKIVGQDKLIKEINRIFQVFVNSNCKIRPPFYSDWRKWFW